jgi:hypothetical protein
MKNTREKRGQSKSLHCVSWADETRAVSHEKTRQGSTWRHTNTSLEGIQKQKPCGQTMWTKNTKDIRNNTTWPKDMQGTRVRATK